MTTITLRPGRFRRYFKSYTAAHAFGDSLGVGYLLITDARGAIWIEWEK